MSTTDTASPEFNHSTARERFDVWRPMIRQIANLLRLDEEVRTSSKELAALIGTRHSAIDTARRLMVFIGALRMEGYGWVLLKDGADLDRAIDLEMERQMRGGLSPETIRDKARPGRRHRPGVTRQSAEKVAVITDRYQEPVGAIVGPEAPKPMAQQLLKGSGSDAPAALVLAAKQYAKTGGRTPEADKAATLMAQLGELGITVPDELVAKARVIPDERLENIGLVLPYIEALERQVVGLGNQLREMSDYGELKRYRDSHKKQNEKDVADRVAAAMREEARR